MKIWKKCKFGCVFSIEDSAWAPVAFASMKSPTATFKCPTCSRLNPVTSYTSTIGGAATATPAGFHATSVMAGGKKVDDVIKARMLSILPGLGFLESTKRDKVNTIYQRLSMLLINAELTSNFPTPRIFSILQSSQMKNMWHFAITDQKYAAERDAGERQIFGGVDKTLQTTVVPDGDGRPVYLVLNVGNLMQGGAAGYGHSFLVYKDAVKMRSTYIATDSLQMIRGEALKAEESRTGVGTTDIATFGAINNVLLRVSDNKLKFLCSLAGGPPHKYVDEFIEAHGWGELNLKQDVKAIVLSQPDLDDFLKYRDDDHKDLFPTELHGMTVQQKTAAIGKLKADLKTFCQANGIELHFLALGMSTRQNIAARPVAKV